MFLLGWLLPDDHDKSADVSKAFINAPIGWQEHLYKLWIPSDISRVHRVRILRQQSDETLSRWVIDIAVDILNSLNWVDYSSVLISGLLSICQDNSQRFVESCKTGLINQKNGLSRDPAETLGISGLQTKYRFQNRR